MKLVMRMVEQIDQTETGAAARVARIKAGKTLQHVAEKLDCSIAYLSDLERGKRGWSEALLKRFEKAL